MDNEHSDEPVFLQPAWRADLTERLCKIGFWYWDVDQSAVFWSRQTHLIHGTVDDGKLVPLEAAAAFYHPDDRPILEDHLNDALNHGVGFNFRLRVVRRDGDIRDVSSVGECTRDETGRTVAIYGMFQDITFDMRMHRALMEAEARHRDFAEMASDWFWEMGPDLRFTYISDRVESAVGIPADYHIGKSREELVPDGHMCEEMRRHLAVLKRHEPFRDSTFWRLGHDGKRHFLSISGSPIFASDGRFLGYRGMGRDLTAEEAARESLVRSKEDAEAANAAKSKALKDLEAAVGLLEERNAELARSRAETERAALRDPLTGVANRLQLDRSLHGLANQRAEHEALAVVHIDINRFKQINDTLGHAAGDAVLTHVSKILKACVGPDDIVARVGGDEFVIVSIVEDDEVAVRDLVETVIQQVDAPFSFEGKPCRYSAYAGVAVLRSGEAETRDLLVHADIALYRAKRRGKGSYEFYSAVVHAEIIAYKRSADAVLQAIENDEFEPFYQLQFDAQTLEISGIEALVRWRHPKEGVISPDRFLGVANDLGVLEIIDRIVLDKALVDHAWLQAKGHQIPKLSVNVSYHRLADDTLIDRIVSANIPHGLVSFELLESVFLDDCDDQIIWNIDRLKEMGIGIELDDFGSGHASIIGLLKLSPDTIKIDRHLVNPVPDNQTHRDLVRSIVEMGRALELRVIAEGVATKDHADIMRDLGCDLLQGFALARPLDVRTLRTFLEERPWLDDLQVAI